MTDKPAIESDLKQPGGDGGADPILAGPCQSYSEPKDSGVVIPGPTYGKYQGYPEERKGGY